MERYRLFLNSHERDQVLGAGESRRLRLGPVWLVLIRKGDELFALEEECPHRGGLLIQGTLNNLGEVVCPLHRYRFNLKTGEEAEGRCRPVRTFTIKADDSGYWIYI